MAEAAPALEDGLSLPEGFAARLVAGWTLHQIDLFEGARFPKAALPIAPGRAWLIDGKPPRVAAARGAVLELSDSRVRLALSGPLVTAVLARCVPIDLRPAAFPVGEGRVAPIHEVAIFLHRTGVEAFDLYLPRSTAVSLWEWIVEAAHNAANSG